MKLVQVCQDNRTEQQKENARKTLEAWGRLGCLLSTDTRRPCFAELKAQEIATGGNHRS